MVFAAELFVLWLQFEALTELSVVVVVIVVAEAVGSVSVGVWLLLVTLYFGKVNVVAFVAVAVEAGFAVSVDVSAAVLVIIERLFSVPDRLPCTKTRTTLSSIFDPPFGKEFSDKII